ncbi:MAG: VanW family protein [Lachnospiraceae bacterium]|nr:VanW family protein [Lachnospiraceae bacterium]
MKYILKGAALAGMIAFLAGSSVLGVRAGESEDKLMHPGYVFVEGTSINGVDVSGMTEEEALSLVREQVDSALNASLTLKGKEEDQTVSLKASELGIVWSNPEIIDEAGAAGYGGNILSRYKNRKDAAREGRDFNVEYSFDREKIASLIKEKCSSFNREPENGKLEFKDGALKYVAGRNGTKLLVDESADAVSDFINGRWDMKDAQIDLKMDSLAYKGTEEELGQCTSVLGTYTTYYYTSTWGRRENIATATGKICGTILKPGEEFSTLDTVCPFSFENGYQIASAYANNKVVESLGGGACQVSTTLYNAVLRAELKISERHNHSMTVSYVQPSEDACITSSGGLDFKFVNDTDYPVYIYGKAENGEVTMTIYGKEDRPENRDVEYQAQILSKTPSWTKHEKDKTLKKGKTRTEYGYTGYTAQLVKIVKEGGKEVSRDIVNKSSYAATPTIIYEGTKK